MANVTLTPRDVARELARRYSTMTHEELDLLESILVPLKYAKNEMILREGETCTNIYWVVRGLVRQFYYKNGKELTEYMATENNIVMCIESLFREQTTHLQIARNIHQRSTEHQLRLSLDELLVTVLRALEAKHVGMNLRENQ